MKHKPTHRFGCAAAAAVMMAGAGGAGKALAQGHSIVGLPPVSPYAHSEAWLATTLPNGSQVIVGASTNSGPIDPRLTRWTAVPGSSPGLLMDMPGGMNRPWLRGISADGQRVVGNAFPTAQSLQRMPYLWTGTSVQQLPIPSGNTGEVRGISADGTVAVGTAGATGIRWVNGTIADTAPGFRAGPLSPDGSISLGYTIDNNQFHLATWTSSGVQHVATFPWATGQAPHAMTPTGDAAIGHRSVGVGLLRSWIYREGTIEDLGLPAGADSVQALGIRGDGNLVAGIAYEGQQILTQSPVVWTPQAGWMDFEPWLAGQGITFPDWTFYNITSVSPDGLVFTGIGSDPAGLARGYVMTIPAPGSGGLVLLTFGLAAVRRQR